MTGASRHRAGLANRILLFFATLVAGLALWIPLNDPISQLIADTKDRCGDVSACSTGIGWMETGWDFVPLWMAIGALVFLVGGAILEARRRPT